MRTTIDLPEDLHRAAKNYAHDRRTTFSEAVAAIMRRGVEGNGAMSIETDPVTGFRVLVGGPLVTSEDVKALEDEE